ncbi:MAG: PIN domain-containing protein [Sphingomonas fennica]
MILIDTNVFSELVKPQPDDRVVDWLFHRRAETLLSTIVAAELDFGVRAIRSEPKRTLLARWLERLIDAHAGRIVDFDLPSARRWGALGAAAVIAGQRAGARGFDTLIAAQALERGLPIATRNVRDFENIGLTLLNPWAV